MRKQTDPIAFDTSLTAGNDPAVVRGLLFMVAILLPCLSCGGGSGGSGNAGGAGGANSGGGAPPGTPCGTFTDGGASIPNMATHQCAENPNLVGDCWMCVLFVGLAAGAPASCELPCRLGHDTD